MPDHYICRGCKNVFDEDGLCGVDGCAKQGDRLNFATARMAGTRERLKRVNGRRLRAIRREIMRDIKNCPRSS